MAKLPRVFFLLMFTLQVYPFAGAVKTLIITNNCGHTVWPAVTASDGTVSHNDSGFALLEGESRTVPIQDSWTGQVWGRTFCSTDKSTGNFTCLTGDCTTGKIQCAGSNTLVHPATLAEFNLNPSNNYDSYDTSLVDGFNLPMAVAPNVDQGPGCDDTGCLAENNGWCPKSVQMLRKTPNGNSSVIGCRDPCDVFRTNKYCCTTGQCRPTGFSNMFKRQCARAYSYPRDDATSLFHCDGSRTTSFDIIFCPSPTLYSYLGLYAQPEIQSVLTPAPLPTPPPLPISTPGPSPSPSSSIADSPATNSTTDHPHQNSSSDGKKKLHRSLMVALPTTAAILSLIFLGICIFNRRRKAVKESDVPTNETERFADSLQFEFNKIRLATHNFAAENKLGKGGFGEVYRGNLENGQEIAVKRLSESKNSVQGIVEFETEIVLVAKLQHKNLVKLLGYCTTPKESHLSMSFFPIQVWINS